MSTPPLSPRQIALGLLQPDEEILWEGKPRHCYFLHRADVWLELVFCVFLLILSIVSVLDGAAYLLFFCLPVLFLGLFPSFRRHYKLRGAWYLITDRQVVLVYGWRVECRKYPNIPYLERSKRHLGVTTLYLLPSEWCTRYTLWETTRGALVNLSDADLEKASAIINRQLYGHKSN